jgi:ABC-type Fe3+-hydroxamate transport system substrate-binding protein
VMHDTVAMHWRDHMLLTGEALGRRGEVEQLFAQYDQRVEQFKQTRAVNPNPPTLATIGFYGEPTPYLLLDGFAYHDLIRDAGIALVPVQGKDSAAILAEFGNTALPLPLERLDLIDADRVVVVIDTPAGATAFEQLQKQAVWQNLPAVRAEQVFVRGNYWYSANPYDLHKVLDDLFVIVAGVDPVSVAPNLLLPPAAAPDATTKAS